MSDLYTKMGKELRVLFRDLLDPKKERLIRRQIGDILATAKQIGGTVQQETEQLHRDIARFLDQPTDPKRLAVVKEHAMRLEQETREF